MFAIPCRTDRGYNAAGESCESNIMSVAHSLSLTDQRDRTCMNPNIGSIM